MAHNFKNFYTKEYTPAKDCPLKGVRITRHEAKSGNYYLISFGCIASKYLKLEEGKAVRFLADEAHPEYVYFETLDKPSKEGSTARLEKRANNILVARVTGSGAFKKWEEFTKGGESIKDYFLFDEDGDGWYAIAKGNPWRG